MINHSIVVPTFVFAILFQRALDDVKFKELVDQATLSEKVYKVIPLNKNRSLKALMMNLVLRHINLFKQDFLSLFQGLFIINSQSFNNLEGRIGLFVHKSFDSRNDWDLSS